MNNYEIIDEFGYSEPLILKDVIKKVLELENVSNSIFSIIFVDDDKIREINKNYRDKDSVTDVISFALMDNETNDFPVHVLGDIFISIPRMKKQALEYAHSEVREISFLCVHGLLHLLGYDHMNKLDEEKMFKKQEEVLNEFEETKKS